MLRLIAEIARVDESEIGLSDDLIDIGLDPMEMATLRTRVTTMFQLSVDAANFECCRTVQDFVSVVETEIGEDDLASEGPAERSTLDFEGLAYTLQVGRESFGHRLAVVASGLEELRDLLQRHLSGQTSLPGVWTGDASVGNSLSDLMLGGEEGAEYLRKLREAHKPDKLARLWVSGIDLDWEILWEGSIPRRMSLPTYPFESRRCWVDAKIHREDLEPHRKDSPKKTELVTMERSSAVVEQLSKSTATPRRSPSGNVLDRVRRVLAEVLGWDPSEISENAGFDELGFTSVLVREAGELFRAEFGLVSTTAMFEFKTVAALASYISTLDNLSPEPEENASAERLRADISSTANVEKKREEPPSSPKDRSPLAIIGMSGRYPMANNLAEFWQNLVTGRDCVSEIPLDRPGWSQYAKVARDRLGEDGYPRWGGFVDGYDAFEPGFFNISPLEARFLDPQERLFIEAAWECVEDAGHTPDDITSENLADNRTRVGVFAGMTYNNYQMYAASQLEQGEWIPVNSQSFSLANRVSYIMNLAGPSITVDTACSSSLGAIHLACSAIRRHECDAAIVGGVNLTLHPSKYVTLAESGFTASDGRCHSFGDGGDGYVPAEGVGAILIKPLSQAIADGDHVYATILGSAMNHDGHTFGYSVPNPIAQAEVVTAALVDAGVTSDTITYVEAHGTGTSLGDPLEIHGLADAFGVDAARTSPCAIGSVKSNIGHAEAAAGIAQVHKVVLQLTHRTLVPTLPHAARLNPKIDFEQAGFHVQCALCPWPNSETGTPRRAGVSSFGAGGVNVHLILEEAPELSGSPKSHEDAPALLVLSARTDSALRAAASRLADHLRNKDLTDNLDSIAWTLQSGRRSLKHRLAAVTHDPLSAADALERFAADGQANGIVRVADGSGRGSIGAAMEKPTKNDDAVDLALIRELAEEWLQGGDPNWRRLYPHGSPVRVPLPTYPFERESYWIVNPFKESTPPSANPVTTIQQALAPASGSQADERPGAVSKIQADLADSTVSERSQILADYLANAVGELLEVPGSSFVDSRTGFFEMGMDSVLATRLVSRIELEIGITLHANAVFDRPTVDELAESLAEMWSPGAISSEPESPSPAGDLNLERVVYTVNWESADPGPTSSVSEPAGPLVIFDLDDRVRTRVTSCKGWPGQQVILVLPGEDYARRNESTYCVRPDRPEDFQRLHADVGSLPEAVWYLWTRRAGDNDIGLLDSSTFPACRLVRSIVSARPSESIGFLYVHEFEETPNPVHEGFGGFGRSVRHESPNVLVRTMGLEMTDLSENERASRIAELCLRELGGDVAPEQEIRYRWGRRWVRVLRETRTDESASPCSNFDTDGACVITGGAGGLGLIFARHLIDRGWKNLVLTGRSAETERHRMEVNELRRLGAQVSYHAVDVTDYCAINDLMGEVRSQHGRVTGIIHAAGILDDGMLVGRSIEQMRTVIAPKLSGALNLDAATSEDPLEFFVVFSSMAAIGGNPGQTDYAFANRFLCAFVSSREEKRISGQRHGVSRALVWPTWREGGMDIDEETRDTMLRRLGIAQLDTESGVGTFEAALSGEDPEVGVVVADLGRLSSLLPVERFQDTPTTSAESELEILLADLGFGSDGS